MQNGDADHREVLGPLLSGAGPSGVVVVDGWVLAEMGRSHSPGDGLQRHQVDRVAGGLLELDTPVSDTSGSDGELWGKPADVDAQSRHPGSASPGSRPGEGWAYHDVRVNPLCWP